VTRTQKQQNQDSRRATWVRHSQFARRKKDGDERL